MKLSAVFVLLAVACVSQGRVLPRPSAIVQQAIGTAAKVGGKAFQTGTKIGNKVISTMVPLPAKMVNAGLGTMGAAIGVAGNIGSRLPLPGRLPSAIGSVAGIAQETISDIQANNEKISAAVVSTADKTFGKVNQAVQGLVDRVSGGTSPVADLPVPEAPVEIPAESPADAPAAETPAEEPQPEEPTPEAPETPADEPAPEAPAETPADEPAPEAPAETPAEETPAEDA